MTVINTSISPALEGFMPWLKVSGLQFLLPTKITQVLVATREFRQYMDETIARERMKPATADTKLNLISTLIKATDTADQATKARLSDVELRGNIFIFTVGGLESTSITLSYALALLAIHPEIQEWVVAEVLEVMNESEAEYAKAFPKLTRVMAVMVCTNHSPSPTSPYLDESNIQAKYETLRIYGPSPPLPRSSATPHTSFSLPTTSDSSDASKLITLPPSTQIMLNSWACHTSASHFPNPKTWDPKRWIQSNGALMHPTPGLGFFAWGAGPRICPGMKFSQVEFCAVLASVLNKVRVGLRVEADEKHEAEKARLLSVLNDTIAEPLLLHVRRPEELWLQIAQRE